MTRPIHAVTARRNGDGWTLDAEAGTVVTVSRTLESAEASIRRPLAQALGVGAESFDISIGVALDDAAQELVSRAARERLRAQAARTRATASARLAARALNHRGIGVRDAGRILGVAHQRVAQLLDTDESPDIWLQVLATPDSDVPSDPEN